MWKFKENTLPETNSMFTPENWRLEDDSFPILVTIWDYFQGANLLLLSGRVEVF